MQCRFCLCAILSSPLFWYFAASPVVAQQTTPELLELRGKVVNSVTGEPVSGALVQAPGQKAQFTGPDGTFAFSDLQPGDYLLSARKPGFFDGLEPQRLGATQLSAVGQNEQVILKLTPEAIIYGELKSDDGHPLEGLIVRALHWQVQNGERQLIPAGSVVTDDQGSFRLAQLSRGRYYLSFQSSNIGSWSNSSRLRSKKHEQQGYGLQFYPGVPDAESATTIEIRAGAQVHVAQSLGPLRLFDVAGVVQGAAPESGFDVALINPTGETAQNGFHMDSKTGQFQIMGVPAGTYLLRATANRRPALRSTGSGLPRLADEDRPPLIATLPLHIQGDVSGLVVVLGSGISVGVQVRDEILDNAVANKVHQVSLQLTPQEFPASSSWITVPTAPGDRRAQTRFDGLVPGTYTVSANPHGPWYISSLRCGGVDLLRDDLTLAPGVAPPPIEITVRDDGSQLNVKTMESGQPSASGVVLFSREYPKRSQLFRSTNSLSVGNLAPGKYYVIALRGAENAEYRNPAAMQRYLTHATEVTLGPRAEASVTAEVQEPVDGVQ